MQKQNFEKEVQQKMEELSFTPSEPVWHKIEEGLKKKREKRRLLVWLLPLLFAVGGGVWWNISYHPSQNKIGKAYSAKKEGQPQELHLPVNNKPVTGTKEKNYRISKQKSPTPKIIDPKTTIESHPVTLVPSSIKNQRINKKKKISAYAAPLNESSFRQKKDIYANRSTDKVEKARVSVKERTLSSDENLSPLYKSDPQKKETMDSLSQLEKEKADSLTHAIVKVDSVKQIQRQHKKNWEWDVYTAFGLSGTGSQLFAFDKSYSARLDAVSTPNYSGVGNYSLPLLNKNGVSLLAGVSVKKKLGRRLSLITGLQYGFYSTHSYVGQKVVDTFYIADPAANYTNNRGNLSSLNTYYKNDAQVSNFRNEYHFIELPIGFEYAFLKRMPLHLQAGVTVSQLLRDNALQYNNLLNVYYKDNSLTRKSRYSLFTNLTYRVWKSKKLSLSTGPQLQYGLSSLQKKQDNRQHLFFAGLKTKISF